ncbi:YchJ family protein [Zobellia sp. B3R18]|uniref:YchJ family protein n=1 Tax=Zobellia sp. B3R18 TaxID=2841568 RepID=UPI001C06A6BA|nr:YchJ family metal-binding protein [Zobellia sp. B3R18]MBU2973395.1 Sec-C motif domain protein [Zobellia sp. B3R18]
MKCPCNPNVMYSVCCQKAHANINSVATAETLMRSRYSAFVLANIDYLQKSHHSLTRPSKSEKRKIEAWAKSVNWVKLEILRTSQGTNSDTEGTVEFKAYYIENGQMGVIHENSNFKKENGHWTYIDGLHKP